MEDTEQQEPKQFSPKQERLRQDILLAYISNPTHFDWAGKTEHFAKLVVARSFVAAAKFEAAIAKGPDGSKE